MKTRRQTIEETRAWIKRWEESARKAAADRNYLIWDWECTKIWTAEFLLGLEPDLEEITTVRLPFRRSEDCQSAAKPEALCPLQGRGTSPDLEEGTAPALDCSTENSLLSLDASPSGHKRKEVDG